MFRRSTILKAYAKGIFSAGLFVLPAAPPAAFAQARAPYGYTEENRVILSTSPNTGILTFKVFAEHNGSRLSRQAIVRLVNVANHADVWQATEDNSESLFTDVPYGDYEAEISAVGYLSSHESVRLVSTHDRLQFDIVLHRDPAAVNLDVADTILSPRVRKETKRAVESLKSNKLADAQRHLDAAYKDSPADPNLNFLLGYLYFQKRDFTRASDYLTAAITTNPHNPQALTLLGRADLERKDYPAARSALEKAVLADNQNWLPHNLLADAYLHEKNYPKARDEAQVAIAKGKQEASASQLVLGQALLNLGESQAGVQALQLFLQESPGHPIAGQVRSLIAQVQDQNNKDQNNKDQNNEDQNNEDLNNKEQSSNRQLAEASSTPARLPGVDPLLALPGPKLSVKDWQPPGVDDVQLSLAPGVACPTDKVIDESGQRVQALVDDVAKFAAVEDLFHQALDNYGTPVRTETRKFNYVASITEPQPGFLAVDEYRADKLTLAGYPDQIASTGFAALALVFHPHMRDNFQLVCEGLGDWHGQAAWLVHFRQREDRPNRMHEYKVGNRYVPVPLKGRAYITADKFQIVRIEAELVNPLPEIQLLSEHQVVEYGPVPFAKKNTTLWLPKSAEIYFDFRRHRYYRRHSFDQYMLFSTETEEKRKEPVAQPADKPVTEDRKPSGPST